MSDLLVISPAVWRSRLEAFARYKDDTGVETAVLTLDDIDRDHAGRDLPEKIKRSIESAHRTDGVQYVMLVGDSDRFPVRYVRAIKTEWGTKWYPSDLYYADLYDDTGTFDDWDHDNDGIYGEIDFANRALKQTNIDKINMIPDVAVGRVPVSTDTELATYLDKVTSYEFAARESMHYRYPSNWATRALVVVDGGKRPFGDETLAAQYTSPLLDAGISITSRHQDDPPWDGAPPQQRAAEINRALNDGIGILCYFGHGHVRSFHDWYTPADMSGLANDAVLPIVYAISCLTARFHVDFPISGATYEAVNGGDWTGGATPAPEPASVQPAKHDRDSMAEEFLVKRDSGAVAYLGTTSKIEHGGKNLAQYFFEAYRDLPKPPLLGEMWRRALSKFARTDALQGMNGYFAFIHLHKVMLFGDPSLRVGGIQAFPPPPSGAELRADLVATALG